MSKYQTENRRRILDYFRLNTHRSISAQDIQTDLHAYGISISSIYRVLSSLEEEGILCKTSDPKRSCTLYQYIDPHSCSGIIHLKCQICDETFHVNKHVSHMLIELAKEDYSFAINDSSAFLYGKCMNCQQTKIESYD